MMLLKTLENSHTVINPGVVLGIVTLLRVPRLLQTCICVPGRYREFSLTLVTKLSCETKGKVRSRNHENLYLSKT